MKNVFVLLAGLTSLTFGIYLFQSRLSFIYQATKTEGVITEIESRRTSSKTYYYPIVSYQDVEGDQQTMHFDLGTTGGFDYSVGETITILYIPDEPDSAKVWVFWEMWGVPSVLSGVGIIFILIGIGNLRGYFSQKQNPEVANE
jgi:hypothetical protein